MSSQQILRTARSRSLFHFTDRRVFLEEILINRAFFPRYCFEDVSWSCKSHGSPEYGELGYPMVCFCDIPLTRIVEHTTQYGSFGIGLTREWAEDRGLNPVAYINPLPRISPFFVGIAPSPAEEVKSRSEKRISPLAKFSMEGGGVISVASAHTKPLRGVMTGQEGETLKDFYQESEWRYVPYHFRQTIDREEWARRVKRTKKLRDEIKASIKDRDGVEPEFAHIRSQDIEQNCGEILAVNDPVSFEWKDVAYIFVRRDGDIHKLVNFIRKECTNREDTDDVIDWLISRMISLETLTKDL